MFYLIVLLVLSVLIVKYLLFRKKEISHVQRTIKHVFGITSYTNRGEKVRSKAEKTVADYLFSSDIDYIYEKTIILGKQKRKIKYDFYLPFENVYVEYWGLENSITEIKLKYLKRKQEKLKLYNYYKLSLISLYPEDLDMIDTIFPIKLRNSKSMYAGIRHKLVLWLRSILFHDYQFYQYTESQNKTSNIEFCVICGIILPGAVVMCNRCGFKVIL